jgi:hypothetical protein
VPKRVALLSPGAPLTLLEQAAAMRTAYCAKDPDAERRAATLCAAPRLRQLARRIRDLGQGSSAVAEALLGAPLCD